VGEAAASGGYFIAMGADHVVVTPGSLLGSIGVFAGKFVASDLTQKLGVTWDSVAPGNTSALMFSTARPFTPEEWQKLEAQMDVIYADFKQKVAQSRNLPLDKVQELAQGKIWTGPDAVRLGLADELGGFGTSEAALRRLLKLEPNTPLTLMAWPAPKTPVEELLDFLTTAPPQLQALGRTLQTLSPAIEWLHESGVLQGLEVVQQPILTVR
jgi:protease-4